MLSLLVAVAIVTSKVRYTGSDPRGSLVVAESVLRNGTIKLDQYDANYLKDLGTRIYQNAGHSYYLFPLGTSVLSIPAVAAANAIGIEMVQSEHRVQMILTILTAMLMIAMLYRLARQFLEPGNAALAAGLFWFGTSLASTGATALWSHNLATLFGLIALDLAIRDSKAEHSRSWARIGLCLFLAYFCRPTLSLLSPFLLLFLFARHRLAAVKAGLVLAALLGGFVAFSQHEFGQVLPSYYLPSRVSGASDVTTALYGNLFSPARGLLVFSPFLVAVWLCARRAPETFRLNPLWWGLGLAWPVLHLIVISRFPHWWAGWSYGPRLLMDVLPGLFLLTLRAWPTALDTRRLRIAAAVLAVTAVFSVFVHTCQGLYNGYSLLWNAEPPIDQNPQNLFDWKYPQFLHTRTRHQERVREYGPKSEVSSQLKD
ncbi:glycosyltransferase family 39 protein [Microvirga sp. KLBC 81]|uniref:glycosyltransferase family 39 protein n=1 Tax=Microvirga sp. KLBC 81 TaxID=1862707 RepID=UPI0014025B8D|nr:glycosyltransferase family 39 protein [Microvirga sp. KLBC 81]